MDRLQTVLEHFARTSGLTASLIDHESGKMLLTCGGQEACVRFHRAVPSSRCLCEENNRDLIHSPTAPGDCRIALCHAGMAIGAIPLVVGERHYADILVGQVFTLPPREDDSRQRAAEHGYEMGAYWAAVKQAPVIREEQLRNSLLLLGEYVKLLADTMLKNGQLAREHERLQQQFAFNQSLLDAIPIPVYYKDKEGRYVGCNQSFAAFFGATRETILNKTVRDFRPPEHAQQHEEWDEEMFRTQRPQRYECGETLPGGEQREYLFYKAPFEGTGCPTSQCAVGVMVDITDRKRAEEKVKLAATVFENTAEGIMITDDKTQIIAVNEAFVRLTGLPREKILGRRPSVLKSGRHNDAFYQAMWDQIARTGHWQGEIWNRRQTGEIYPEWLTISTVLNEGGQVINYIGVFDDISAIKQSQQRIEFLATHDSLTELPNRTLFYDRLEHILSRAGRYELHFAVLFIDLDNFKVVNDKLGHDSGDRLLARAAGRLKNCLRDEDTLARIGGDEFTVLMEGGRQQATICAERILEALAIPFTMDTHQVTVTTSIGIALYPRDGRIAQELIKQADSAMYRAKEDGKNAFRFYGTETL